MRSVRRRDTAAGKRAGTRVRGGRLPRRRAHIRHDRRQHRQHDQQHERGPRGVSEPHGRRQTVHGVPSRFQGAGGPSHQVVRLHVGEQTGTTSRRSRQLFVMITVGFIIPFAYRRRAETFSTMIFLIRFAKFCETRRGSRGGGSYGS